MGEVSAVEAAKSTEARGTTRARVPPQAAHDPEHLILLSLIAIGLAGCSPTEAEIELTCASPVLAGDAAPCALTYFCRDDDCELVRVGWTITEPVHRAMLKGDQEENPCVGGNFTARGLQIDCLPSCAGQPDGSSCLDARSRAGT